MSARWLCFGLIGLALFPALAQAQQPLPALPEVPPIIARVDLSGERFFPDEELRLRLRTRPNRRFLGVPGVTWWLWLYRLGSSAALDGGLGRALQASGEPPAFLDSTVVAADVERLRLFYEQEGFPDATVAAEVRVLREDRVAVTFFIEAGAPTFVREVRYEGLRALNARQRRQLVRGTLLRHAPLDSIAALRFRARNQRYSEPTLLEEGRRILTFLRNQGYAAATRDSINAIIIPAFADSFDVVFRVRPGPRYRFGEVAFSVIGPQTNAPLRTDTLASPAPSDTVRGGLLTFRIASESRLDVGLLTRTLRFRPGQWYDQSRLLATKRRLDATGVFAFTDLAPLPPEDSTTATPRLPHRLDLRTRQPHQIRFETFMLQRSGALADSDNEVGAGLGVTYDNLNLFGGGEAFRLRTTGSLAADLARGLSTSAQWEVTASLVYPYLVAPFRRLDERLNLYDARTRLSVSLLAARRDALRLVLRGRGAARFRLEMQHSPTITSLVDLLDVTLSNPDTLDGFREIFLEDVLDSIEDPVQRAQIVEDYTRPQINNALRYTLRTARVNPLVREDGYSYEAALEVGGNLPYLLDRLVFSPSTLEGSLPGLPIFGGTGSDNRLLYRQYLRFIGDARQYRPIGRSMVFAWKLIAGLAQPTGRANTIPFDRRFYSGGAASVRGWRLRELGPGSVTFVSAAEASAGEVTNILGGDIKLEAAAELRQTLIGNLFAARWIGTVFADMGNVWFGPRNPGDPMGRFRLDRFYEEVGVGSGVGVRLAWEYFLVRLDLAVKVHDPVRQGVFFPDGVRRPLLHFGIGHAF